MRSYRIVLEYTDNTQWYGHPETWDWGNMLNIGVEESLSVVNVEDIEMPEAHKEDFELREGLTNSFHGAIFTHTLKGDEYGEDL